MAHASPVNHWWHATLHLTPRGLTTSTVPYGDGAFDVEFDSLDHQLLLGTSDGGRREVALAPKPVAQFYAETIDTLGELCVDTCIHGVPNEVDPAIPFA